MKGLPLLLALAAFMSVAPRNAQASLVRAMDLAELTSTAEQVVVAEVGKIQSHWDRDHRNIYTTVEIRVQESWKGTPPSDGKIVLSQPGGTVGNIEMTVVGMPAFAVGERAVLFVHNAGVVGMGQGKRTVRWDPSAKQWLVAPGQAEGTVRMDRKGHILAAPKTGEETLDSLRGKVRALLGK